MNYFLVYSTQRQGIYVITFGDVTIPEKYANYPTVASTEDFTTNGILNTLASNDFTTGTLGTNFAITFSLDSTSATKATDLTQFTEQVWVINPLKIVGGNSDNSLDVAKYAAKRRMSSLIIAQKNKFNELQAETERLIGEAYNDFCEEMKNIVAATSQTVEAKLSETVTQEEKDAISLLVTLGVPLNPRQLAIKNGHLTSDSIEAYANSISNNLSDEDEDFDEDTEYCDYCDEELDDCSCEDSDEDDDY